MSWSAKFITLFGILCYTSLWSQSSSKLDSLVITLDTITVDTQKVDRLLDITYYLRSRDFELAEQYANQAFSMADSIDYEWGKSSSLFHLGVIVRKLGRHEEAIEIHQLLIKEALEKEDYMRAASNANSLGNTYQGIGEYKEAVASFLKAIEAYEKEGYRYGQGMGYNNIGIVFKNRKQFDKAKDYFLRAIDAYQNVEEHKLEAAKGGLAWTYMNLGNVTENDSLALEYYKKSLSLHEGNDNPYGIASVNICIGSQYMENDQNEIAEPYYLKALAKAEEVKSKGRIATAKSSLGKIYLEKGDLNTALNYSKDALDISLEIGHKDEEEQTRRNLAQIYSQKGAYQKANEEYQKVIVLRDSLYSDKDTESINELQAKYDLKEKEAQITAKELEVAKEKNLRNQLFLIAAGIIIAGLLFFFAYANSMRRKREAAQLALVLEEQKNEQLKELDKIKSNFFANIAHEFRTPLTLILSPLREMAEGIFKGNQQHYLGLMKRNAERLLTLVNQLLDLSKLESGKMKLNIEKKELGKFIRNLAFSFQSMADRKQINYQIHLPKGEFWGAFDVDKLEKVITNLLSNAFKFTPEEGNVILRVSTERKDLEIEVIDNGIGIPKDKLNQIFDRFYQVTNTDYRTDEGSGIGLALTKELVELHAGSIVVESEEQAHTSFKISLPILTEAVLLPSVEAKGNTLFAEKQETIESTKALADASIVLVVEDNEDLRAYISERLKPSFKVETAENGLIGRDKAKEMIPDLIISDVMMPEMNGMEMCEILKNDVQTSHIPIIMLTAKGEMEDKLEGLEKGADDYLSKPFDARELEIRIKNLIEQRNRLREKYSQSIISTNQKEQIPKESDISPEERFIQRMINVIEANMEDENFNVEMMAKAMFLSRYQLHRKVKALTGKSISVFIRTIRLKHAHRLLEAKKGNVSEIAFQLGFNSVAYFSKCFTEEFGYSPSKLL